MADETRKVDFIGDSPSEIVDPKVLEFIFQASQTAALNKMRRLEESKVPAGTDSAAFTVPASGIMKYSLHRPWISFSLVNNGPNSIYAAVNNEDELLKTSSISSGDTFQYDGTYPTMWTLFLKTATATGAAGVVIRAKVGKWTATPLNEQVR